MPRKTIKDFSVEWLQVLDEHGVCDEKLRPPLSDAQVRSLYEWMVLARVFDEKAYKLQREGRLGTYASILGQEAAQIASALALEPSDWMFPSFREPGASIVRGLPLKMILQYWSGDERGSIIPQEQNDFPISIPVATQIPIGAGVAWGAKYKGDNIAVLVYLGDGATSKGDFHEGLNAAGVLSLPVVFLCQNNQWAISVPRHRQTAAETLAQKAIAYGFPGIQVDGNDVFAVYSATDQALKRARAGQGPTFIEAVTYRIGDHTTADDASRYRSAEEVAEWKNKDPIDRLIKYMATKKLWDEAYGQKVTAQARERVEAAVNEQENTPPPDVRDIFLHTFQELPAELASQMEAFLSEIGQRDGNGAGNG
jgi:pyruvate dehydrogenase E1 component alpha subunit